MSGHYKCPSGSFTLFQSPSEPAWRASQRGALAALMAHWSLPHGRRALVSVPTGSGKSAIATAAPYLIQACRVLVVVPSRALRAQLSRDFETESDLHSIGARRGMQGPVVHEVSGRVETWSSLLRSDVVVALPNSISPLYYPEDLPPNDLFDLLIIDEAHHAPAPTWQAILDHFHSARALLLTATPQRRDGQRVPGELIYHYPLRQALEDGVFKPVRPVVLDLGPNPSHDVADALIADATVALTREPAHATSSVLIRAATVERAKHVAKLYEERGLPVTVLSSRMSPSRRSEIVDKMRSGEISAVAVVDMLGEGFNLPRLRIAAYHDKHKSSIATIQLIGRLARSSPSYPQDSVIVTGRDTEVYPQLQGMVRDLWSEDADWTRVLPGLIDDEVAESIADREYAALFSDVPPELSIEAVRPVVRSVLYEVPVDGWEPAFLQGAVPDELAVGQYVHGQTVIFSATTPTNLSLVVVTTSSVRPRWHAVPGLDSPAFDLHLLTWRSAARTDQTHVLAVNSADGSITKALLRALDASRRVRIADPRRLQDAFDSLSRVSVSNVGVRNTYLGIRGVPAYKTFAGSDVDVGLRDADTGRAALGHAMAQIVTDQGTYTAGIATGKAKLWESRYVRLRTYEDYILDFVDRYWIPPSGGPGRLLPGVTRGERLVEYPDALIAAIELDPALYGSDWTVGSDIPLDNIDLRVDETAEQTAAALGLVAFDGSDSNQAVWRGWQDINGVFHDTTQVDVRRGFGALRQMSQLLSSRPPSVYYGTGQTVIGGVIYAAPIVGRGLPNIVYDSVSWRGVDFKAETRRQACENKSGISIHAALEDWLIGRPRRGRHRWILCNDGSREIADYVVIEIDDRVVHLGLWHAKGSKERTASVRLGDMQTVIAQAIKSRRWVTDRTLWAELGARLCGESSPKVTIVEGSRRLLEVICGRILDHPNCSFTRRTPNVDCEIGIAQPGITAEGLQRQLSQTPPPIPAQQIRELLTVCHDAVGTIASLTILTSV